MKKAFLLLAMLLFIFQISMSIAIAAEGKTIFCSGVDENWEPINPGSEFASNVVSCFFVNSTKFGAINVLLSIYSDKPAGQALLHRETVEINPSWAGLLIKDVPLPAVGKYTFTLASTTGDIFTSGQVTIKEKTIDKPIPETSDFSGSSLEKAFNRYLNQAK